MAARMKYFLRRSPPKPMLTDDSKEKMERIANCTGCNHCRDNCPYGLDTPAILKEMLADYREFYAENA
jgi:Fe-S oxidoreductase